MRPCKEEITKLKDLEIRHHDKWQRKQVISCAKANFKRKEEKEGFCLIECKVGIVARLSYGKEKESFRG